MNEFERITLGNWHIRLRRPTGLPPYPVALLLHGLTGDENVMGIFASRLPGEYLVLSPRGVYPSPAGGFSWLEKDMGAWPPITEFQEPISHLLDLLDLSENHFEGDFSAIHLMGFSQGTALAYATGFTYPERVRTISGLAGFMPTGSERLANTKPLAGKKAFVSHGAQDDRVPVERARQAVKILQLAGAEVVYCEADVGHKLDSSCFRALGHFHKTLHR